MSTDRAFSFGPFVLFADRGILVCEKKPVRIGSRALEILTALAERAGIVVTGEDLIARTWPDTHVEENTLRVHLVSLRKVLASASGGSQYIANVPGRGYRFCQPVRSENGALVTPRVPLPDQPSPVFGRSHDIESVLQELRNGRVLNITGPGGCGKTVVGLAVAHAIREHFRDGVVFADFSFARNAYEVTSEIARAMAVVNGPDIEIELLSQFRNMEALLLFDNCEHVVERIATFSRAILQRAPAVRILATSQEALRIPGELQYRLPPLEVPTNPNAICTINEALSFSSMQLFLSSIASSGIRYEFVDKDISVIAAVCKQLEGMPLYIELAAAALAHCTPKELAEDLDHSLSALTQGKRTAPIRQKTVRDSVDWSFRLLSPEEQNFLISLTLFDEPFDRASAMLMADFDQNEANFALELLSALVAKFWLTPVRNRASTRYRLSSLARLYLREKLCRQENAEVIRRRFSKLKPQCSTKKTNHLTPLRQRSGGRKRDPPSSIALATRCQTANGSYRSLTGTDNLSFAIPNSLNRPSPPQKNNGGVHANVANYLVRSCG